MNNELENSSLSTDTTPVNIEWQLAEMVDAIAAEIDHAEDTLSLKSYARGMSFAIKQLSLDLQVNVRRDDKGRILFRTADANQSSATVIKLDFAQILESQLQGRRQLDRPADRRPLANISGITEAEIQALNAIAIYSIDDLERYTQTAAMLAEVSRKTGIADIRLRKWRQLPYIEVPKPAKGIPGSTVLLEGGNFGNNPDPNTVVLFQGKPATITSWSDSRIIVTMPQASGTGVLFAVIGGEMTNTVPWEATTVDLVVRDIVFSPGTPAEGDAITFKADLLNQGGGASGAFNVQWTIDDKPQPLQPHGTLQPGQVSEESSIYFKLENLSPGKHTIRFTADPENKLPDVNRGNSTFSQEFVVTPRNQMTIGDSRKLEHFDPLRMSNLSTSDIFGLLFRGLVTRDPKTGEMMSDIAKSWTVKTSDNPVAIRNAATPNNPGDKRPIDNPSTPPVISRPIDDKIPPIRRPPRPIDDDPRPPKDKNWQQIVTFTLREDVFFHNGSKLTADDVVFTYQMVKQTKSIWNELTAQIIAVQADNATTVSLILREQTSFKSLPIEAWMLPIVPARIYKSAPEKFGFNPIGCGAFQIESFAPGSETMKLTAFREYFQGQPRLDSITMLTINDSQKLVNLIREGIANAVVLPYNEKLYNQIKDTPEWIVQPVPASAPTLIYAQSKQVLERQPNSFDLTWNAHLWYVQKG
ncbi:MAG: ABC transporter substrate-binding protein [Nostocaceae cyanobacterium]|nr:ABC transporter substrate-binding protein [Nostocaceae cyanobacterium]